MRLEREPVRLLFGVTLAIQAAHQVEHVVQLIQWAVFKVPRPGGILGQFADVEWVHFVFNTGLWAALLVSWVALRFFVGEEGHRWLGWVTTLQTYHVVEHIFKFTQFQHGMPAPGLLGTLVAPPYLHFFLNLAVLLLMAGAYRDLARPAAGQGRRVPGGDRPRGAGLPSLADLAADPGSGGAVLAAQARRLQELEARLLQKQEEVRQALAFATSLQSEERFLAERRQAEWQELQEMVGTLAPGPNGNTRRRGPQPS